MPRRPTFLARLGERLRATRPPTVGGVPPDDDIPKRAHALAALVRAHLPAEFDAHGDNDAWPLIATGLLSRMTTTLEQLMTLRPHGLAVDAGTLVRSLYEHVVHLAWLAADPSAERIEEWRKDDLSNRVTTENDARRRGTKLFEDDEFEALKAQVAALKGNKLFLEQLADAADKHWAGKLPGMGKSTTVKSFRGTYVFLYRNYSGTAHPTYRGLNPVIEDVSLTRKRVVLEAAGSVTPPYGLATVIYAQALFVAAASLDWPAKDDVLAAFERFPGAAT
jgi:hypothetical protein